MQTGIFFFLGVLMLSWAFSWLTPNNQDLLIIMAVCCSILSVSHIIFFHKLIDAKGMLWLLLIYAAPFFYLLFNPPAFLPFLLGSAFLVSTFAFLYPAVFSSHSLRIAGLFGVLSGGISILYSYLIFGNRDIIMLHWFLPALVLACFYLFVLIDLNALSVITRTQQLREMPVLLKYTLTILVVLVVSYLLGSVIHELGHSLTARAMGCENVRAVLYDAGSSNPYTEMSCPAVQEHVVLLALMGSGAVLAVALLLYVFAGGILRAVSYCFASMACIGSYQDLLIIGTGKNLITFVVVAGIAFFIAGMMKIDTMLSRKPAKSSFFEEWFKKETHEMTEHEYKQHLAYWLATITTALRDLQEAVTAHVENRKSLDESVEKAEFFIHLTSLSVNLTVPPPSLVQDKHAMREVTEDCLSLTRDLSTNIRTKDENYNDVLIGIRTLLKRVSEMKKN